MVLTLRRRAATWRRSTSEVTVEMWRQWRKDRVSGLAAEIAFFGALSIFPGLLVVASALGFIDRWISEDVAADVEDAILDQLAKVLGRDSGLEDAVRDLFAEASPGVLTFGALAGIYSASRGFSAIVAALDVVYDHHERRPWLMRRLVGFVLATGTLIVGALTLAVLVVGPLLGRGPEIAERLGLGDEFATAWDWTRVPLTVVVLALWAATVYHVAPSHGSPWRWELPGAVLSAVGWIVVSYGLRIYFDAADSDTNEVLGAIGGALSLMFWLFALATGFLVGGELNAIIARRHGVSFERRTTAGEVRARASALVDALRRRGLRLKRAAPSTRGTRHPPDPT